MENPPRFDGNTGEHIESARDWIIDIIQVIMIADDLPSNWKHGTVIPIHINHDIQQCSNYRP